MSKARSFVGRIGSHLSWTAGAVLAAFGMLTLPVAPASGATAADVTSGDPVAYVTNSQLASVSIYVGAKFTGTINVGAGPTGIAITPDNSTAYVADYGFNNQPAQTVTPINLKRSLAGKPIAVGVGPLAIAVTPGGRFAVVTLQGTAAHPGHQVREINLATRAVSAPVEVGTYPESLAISPDGTTAYVGAFSSAKITPVDLTTWPPRAETPILLPGTAPRAIAISSNGAKAYVLDAANATIIPITLSTRKVGPPVGLVCVAQGSPGCTPSSIVISADGRTAYVAAAGSADVIMLNLPTLTVAGVLQVGAYPDAVALSGNWLYVGNGASNTLSVFSGLSAPRTVTGVTYPFGIAVVPGGESTTTASSTAISSPLSGHATVPSGLVTERTQPTPFYGFPEP